MISGYIGLGSNLDDPPHRLLSALYELEMNPRFDITRMSWVYESPPWGYDSPNRFCNQVIEFEWRGLLGELWTHTLQVEANLGRVRNGATGQSAPHSPNAYRDRTIDLDLLDVSSVTDTDRQTVPLHLPHPRANQRAFVLVPWSELDPNYVLESKPLVEWLAELPPAEVTAVRRLEEDELPNQVRARLLRSGK